MTALSTNVLVLNRAFVPVHITTVRRAITLLYLGIARAVDREYQTFDFHSWAEISDRKQGDTVGLVGRVMAIPRVILLVTYDRLPRRHVRFSRYNIFLRDRNTCQYCGRRHRRSQLNIDHVIPRSRGGKTVWENVVCSCMECNRKKGGVSPQEAGLKLLRQPMRPHWTPLAHISLKQILYEEWRPFFDVVDFSYWNAELEE